MGIVKETQATLELPPNNSPKAIVKWKEGGLCILIHQDKDVVQLDKSQFKTLMEASQEIYADLEPQVKEKK